MTRVITEIDGIGPVNAKKLQFAGINSLEALLELGGLTKLRKQIALDSGLPESVVLNWVNMADLLRINGVGRQFAQLLMSCEVYTVKELSSKEPAELLHKMTIVNHERNISKVIPNLSKVRDFIEQSKSLEKKVFH